MTTSRPLKRFKSLQEVEAGYTWYFVHPSGDRERYDQNDGERVPKDY